MRRWPGGPYEGLEGDRLAMTNGRSIRVSEVVRHGEHRYAVPRNPWSREHPRRTPGTEVRPGTVLVRYLGYRISRTAPATTLYYLVCCSHGILFPTPMGNLAASHHWKGHTEACQLKERLCQWCGEDDRARFHHATSVTCRACGKTASRVGRFGCGKPMRIRAPNKAVKAEHNCEWCEPWPRRGG